jgi:DUF1009 family protein
VGRDLHALGLIAGRGRFPLEVARALRRRGTRVAAVALRGETDPELEAEVDSFEWVYLGELGRLVEGLRAAGASEAVMAGKVPKTRLYGDLGSLRPDGRALALLARLADRKDDTILRAIAGELEAEGIRLRAQAEVAPDLFAGPGPLGRRQPTAAQLADVAFAWPIAKALGGLDIGQTVVVRERAVLAVEAIEGTDATIARAGALAPGGGITVVKVAKPDQDPRFDMPAIGLDTLKALREAKAGVLAFEAGRTVVLDRLELAREADALGIAVVGVPPEGPVS